MAASFKYTVVRVNPDRRRGETVNLGLVIFLSDRLDVRLLPTMAKVRALGAGLDPQEFYDLPMSLEKISQNFQTAEDKFSSLQMISGLIQFSEMGWFEAVDQKTYESMVDRLMNDLVVPKTVSVRRVSETKIATKVKEIFLRQAILGRDVSDIHRHLVVPAFPIIVKDGLYADFALKNGSYHITETIDFGDKSKNSDKFKEAALKVVTLDRAKTLFGPDTKRIVVYSASSEKESELTYHLNLISDSADHVLNFESNSDKAFFTQYMMERAGQTMLQH